MAWYEYECKNGHRTHRITDKLDGGPKYVMCKSCGKRARKILSVVTHKGKHKGPV